jgi:DnaJ domain
VNAYQILGISHRSTPSEIKAAYRRAATTNHPDRGGSHEMMVIINQAYEQVKSRPNTRRNTTRKPTSSAPTPINLSDWFSLYNQLLLVVKHRGYKKGWITYRLEELKPPLEVWQLHGQVMGYKPTFAHHRWKQQGAAI